MPHLVLLYTARLDADVDFDTLCRDLADTMLAQRDDEGRAVFPPGGVRVFAYPAPHAAVADSQRDYGFVYLNLRMAAGRTPSVHARCGQALLASARSHFDALMASGRYVGLTLQIDEGHEVFDAKHSTIHPLFKPATPT